MNRWVSLGALLLFAISAFGHERSTSYSNWDIRGRTAHVTLRLLALDLTQLPRASGGAEGDAAVLNYLAEQLQLLANGEPCAVTDGPRPLRSSPGRVAVEWKVSCPSSGPLQVRTGLLLDVAPSHLHFARVAVDGAPAGERVLTLHEPEWDLAAPSRHAATDLSGTSVGGYVWLGIEHILSGYDHLAFVLALVLLSTSFADVATVVTGFTVAHSITLALAVLGHLRPAQAPVEALIGLSIALVAAENLWLAGPRSWVVPGMISAALAIAAVVGHGTVPAITLAGLALFSACYFGLLRQVRRTSSLRWSIAFIFGLVHGFGFAGVLEEAGLPADRLAYALFGFNAGVELGQLGVVAVVWPLLRITARMSAPTYRWCVDLGSAVIAGLGVFWFVTRAYS